MSAEGEGGEPPLAELARRITSGAVRLAAATAAWLALVAGVRPPGGLGGGRHPVVCPLAGLAVRPVTPAQATACAGVWPLDRAIGRRPATTEPLTAPAAQPGTAEATHPSTAGVANALSPPVSITRLLFPDQAPDLPDAQHVKGEPMNLAYVVGVLLANRDLERRLVPKNTGPDGRMTAVA